MKGQEKSGHDTDKALAKAGSISLPKNKKLNTIYMDLPIDVVKHSPGCNAEVPLHDAYREKLHHYYGSQSKTIKILL